jgi:protocatechuate 3,4-dioxygenase beta subunit
MAGARLVLTGVVMTTACKPVAKAKLDFWQADDKGVYDNRGYTLRGHQFTDDQGRYRLETVVPGLYTGRTEHIHVKIQAPGKAVVTTQLYFPGVAQNNNDGIFDAALLIKAQTSAGTMQGSFDFVVTA